MARVLILSLSDVARCPKGSQLPDHYREDRTCRCDEREQVVAEVHAAKAEVARARARLADALARKRGL